MGEALDPALVVAEARLWIGTPYRHQASRIGAGADCLGVVRGVWRALIGPEPEPLPPYARDWAEGGDAGLMLEAARRWLVAAPDGAVEAGDVLLFRVARGEGPRHCGIATDPRAMVHAYDGHAVAETPIPEVWERRIVGRFWFPGANTLQNPSPGTGEGEGGVGFRMKLYARARALS